MNTWVTGPVPLHDRKMDIFEGTICVILRNGQVYDVRGPGRQGGLLRLLSEERRLPATGNLAVLTFERAPTLSRSVTTEVRLRDGATVTVTVQAAIVPLWQKDPDAVTDVVRRYGVVPERIQELAQSELEESLRVMATESLSHLTHQEVHARADARTWMRLPKQTGLLTVGHLATCSISRDAHAERALRSGRDAHVSQFEEVLNSELGRLRTKHQAEIDVIARRGDLAGRRESAVADAEINTVVGKFLGISPVDVAYPGQRDARLQAQYQTVRAVLEHNLDLLPLLADPAYGGATDNLTRLVTGLFADRVSRQRAPGRNGVGNQPALVAPQIRLVRKAAAAGPAGPLEILLVEESVDKVIGSIGSSGPQRLMIATGPDPVDVAQRALAAAADWCGVRIGARVISLGAPGEPGRIVLTKVEGGNRPIHADVEVALGAWVVAINALLAGAVAVTVDA